MTKIEKFTVLALSLLCLSFLGYIFGGSQPQSRTTTPVATQAEAPRLQVTPPLSATQSGAELKLLSWHCEQAYGHMTLEGEVRNLTNAPIKNLLAVARYYTGTKEFVKSDTALVLYNPIMPGQTSLQSDIDPQSANDGLCGQFRPHVWRRSRS